MFRRKADKSSGFQGTVYLRHSPEFLKMSEFKGKWIVTEWGLYLEKEKVLIPFDNIAFLKED